MVANGLFRTLMILGMVAGTGRSLVILDGARGLFQLQEVIAADGGRRLPTFAELLQSHNIQLTRPALIAALKNPDPEVRDLAAQKLVEDKAAETIPLIVDALASEKVPWTRMNIAFALASYGEETGFAALEDNCKSHDAGTDVKVYSAEYLLRLKRQSKVCLNAVLDSLQNGSNGYKMLAASILPEFHDLSPEDSERVFVGLSKAIRDPGVRLESGESLAKLGDPRGISELQQAIAAEREDAVRWRLEEDLKRLEQKIHQVPK